MAIQRVSDSESVSFREDRSGSVQHLVGTGESLFDNSLSLCLSLCFSQTQVLSLSLFKVENNSLELTRIFKESFKDQR